MTITVLSKDACTQCTATYRRLDAAGIDYVVEDIYSDENLERVKALGYMAAPVVIAGDKHWSGFRPDKIAELASELKAA